MRQRDSVTQSRVRNGTVIGEYSHSDGIQILAGEMSLEALTVQAQHTAVRASGSARLSIHSGDYTGYYYGVGMSDSASVIVRSGRFSGRYAGLSGNISLAYGSSADKEPWLDSGGTVTITPLIGGYLSQLSYQVAGEPERTVADFVYDRFEYSIEFPSGIAPNASIAVAYQEVLEDCTVTANEGVILSGGQGTAVVQMLGGDGKAYAYTLRFTTLPEAQKVFDLDGRGFARIEAALTYLWEDNQTIRLIEDHRFPHAHRTLLDAERPYTLDLGGHKLTAITSDYTFMILEPQSKVRVCNGEIDASYGSGFFVECGKLSLDNLTINAKNGCIISNGRGIAGTEVRIHSGTYITQGDACVVKASSEASILIRSGRFANPNGQYNNTITRAGEVNLSLEFGSSANADPWVDNNKVKEIVVTAMPGGYLSQLSYRIGEHSGIPVTDFVYDRFEYSIELPYGTSPQAAISVAYQTLLSGTEVVENAAVSSVVIRSGTFSCSDTGTDGCLFGAITLAPGSRAEPEIWQGRGVNLVTVRVDQQYGITVDGGSADPQTAAAGETVRLTASVPSGQRFLRWQTIPAVTFINGSSDNEATAQFTMPSEAVSAKAVFADLPAVQSVTVTPSELTLGKGQQQTFSALVDTVGGAATTVTWAVYAEDSENAPTESSIDANGVLTVAADESASYLTVSAFSTADPSVFGSAKVTVTESPVTTYRLTLNVDEGRGGSVEGAGVYPENAKITIKAEAAEGFAFKHWLAQPAIADLNSHEAETSFTLSTNVTITAYFEALISSYDITVDGGSADPQTAAAGETVRLTASVPNGQRFVNWQTTPAVTFINGSSDSDAMAQFTMPSGAVSAKAVFEAIPMRTISLNANGGSVSPAQLRVEANRTVELPTPTRSGYRFDGWFTALNGGSQISSSTPINTDMTLYARWTYIQSYIPGSPGTSGGGSSSSSSGTTTSGGRTLTVGDMELRLASQNGGKRLSLSMTAQQLRSLTRSEDEGVIIDLSSYETEADIVPTTLRLTKSDFRALGEAHKALVIAARQGALIVDADAMLSLAAAAGKISGSNLDITLQRIESGNLPRTLTKAQKETAEKALANGALLIDIDLRLGGRSLGAFEGSVEVEVSYDLREGEVAEGVIASYLTTDGEREELTSRYENGQLRFTLPGHFSYYLIEYSPAKAAAAQAVSAEAEKKEEQPPHIEATDDAAKELVPDPDAKAEPEAIILNIDSSVVRQGDTLLAAPPVAPQIINGRTMLPFRYLVQTLLGGHVYWEEATRTITAETPGHTFKMTIDDPDIIIDGETVRFDQAPVIVDSYTLVPLRVFEKATAGVRWLEESRQVHIVPKER